MSKHATLFIFPLLALLGACAFGAPAQENLILEDVYEIALGLPRIHFVIRKDPEGPPLADEAGFAPRSALVDTGVSAISITGRTASRLGFKIEPQARFFDVGVGGEEAFEVSEPLFLGAGWVSHRKPG